jgi:hypothetical protein
VASSVESRPKQARQRKKKSGLPAFFFVACQRLPVGVWGLWAWWIFCGFNPINTDSKTTFRTTKKTEAHSLCNTEKTFEKARRQEGIYKSFFRPKPFGAGDYGGRFFFCYLPKVQIQKLSSGAKKKREPDRT